MIMLFLFLSHTIIVIKNKLSCGLGTLCKYKYIIELVNEKIKKDYTSSCSTVKIGLIIL
jgi:hypothetical protein